MKNVFYSALLFAGICGVLESCTGGDYNVNPSSNANYVINPLTPFKPSQFTWGVGTAGMMGGTINGVAWSTNNVSWSLGPGGDNVLIGSVGAQVLRLDLPSVYDSNLYVMAFHDYSQTCTWSDSVGNAYVKYYSFLGNSGEVYVLLNNSTTIQGMFYAECISNSGQITAITNGYFNVPKP